MTRNPIQSWLKNSCLSLLLLASPVLQATPLDSIALVVNEEPVLTSEVRKTADVLKGVPKYAKLSQQDLFAEAMNNLVLKKIQVQRARALGMRIDDAAVNRAIAKIAAQNNLNIEQFKVALAREGFDYPVFREDIREQILIAELKKRYQQQNRKTDEGKVEDIVSNYFLELTKGSHYQYHDILIKTAPGTSLPQLKRLRNQAWQIRSELINGAPPESLKATLKQTQTSTPSRNISRQLAQLDVGQVSSVIHDNDGFHILKLVDKSAGQKLQLPQEMQVRHILIKTGEKLSDSEAQAKISGIRQRILAGESFTKLAIENSQDTGSAVEGGDLGWSTPDKYVPPFAAAMRAAQPNTLTEPFKTRFGWHILEVTGYRDLGQNTRDIIRIQARNVLANSQSTDGAGYSDWVKELRSNATIEYRIGRR